MLLSGAYIAAQYGVRDLLREESVVYLWWGYIGASGECGLAFVGIYTWDQQRIRVWHYTTSEKEPGYTQIGIVLANYQGTPNPLPLLPTSLPPPPISLSLRAMTYVPSRCPV